MGMGHSVRHVLAALAFAGVLAFFCVLLVRAQVIQGEGYYETSLRSKAKVESSDIYQQIQDKWSEQMYLAIHKILNEQQWEKYLKQGAAREKKARDKRANKRK